MDITGRQLLKAMSLCKTGLTWKRPQEQLLTINSPEKKSIQHVIDVFYG